jgi:signal transduction histidine kinase
MRFRAGGTPTVQSALLLLLLGGAVLPLASAALLVQRDVRRSEEQLIAARLDELLSVHAGNTAARWLPLRSTLITLAHDPAVQSLLDAPEPTAGEARFGFGAALPQALLAPQFVRYAEIRDLQGHMRLRAGDASDQAKAVFPVSITVHAPGSEWPLGEVRFFLDVDALMPHSPGARYGPEAVAVFDTAGRLLFSDWIPGHLLSASRFDWGGARWASRAQRTHDPPLVHVVAVPVGAEAAALSTAFRRGMVIVLSAIVVVILIGALAALVIARSLQRLAHAADRIASGDLQAPVPVHGKGVAEVRALAQALDRMRGSLAGTLDQMSKRESLAAVGEFAGNIAHEVRNPLTAVRLDLERARRTNRTAERDELLTCALEDIDRIDRIVAGTLCLARDGRLPMERIDLRLPLERALRRVQPVFASRSTAVDVQADDEPLMLDGSPMALEQLFVNVLTNAAEAATGGGRIDVTASRDQTGLMIQIRDSGPGFAAGQLRNLGTPLVTTKEGGHGLGLALAMRIARAHAGSLELRQDHEHGGIVLLRLPSRLHEWDA